MLLDDNKKDIQEVSSKPSKEANEEDIAMVDVSVEGVEGKTLIDSCSNLSLITKRFLDKLSSKYEPVGICRGRIRLTTHNDDYYESYMVRIPIKINQLNILVDCRIVDKEEPFYGILLNLKPQIDNRLFIHPMLYSLYQFTSDDAITTIAPINNELEEEELLLCVI
jgi:hypothetical protein